MLSQVQYVLMYYFRPATTSRAHDSCALLPPTVRKSKARHPIDILYIHYEAYIKNEEIKDFIINTLPRVLDIHNVKTCHMNSLFSSY